MRIKIKELSFKRIIEAVLRRISNIPGNVKWKYSSFSKQNRKNLELFRDKHKGERCFIIANGPSLNKMDLSVLDNEYTIGMNRVYIALDDLGLKLNYLVCINELVLEQFLDDFSKLDIPSFINRTVFDKKNFCESTNFINLNSKMSDSFYSNITEPISSGGTVTFVCLQIAFFMGFEEVIIVGMDHNFHDKGTPNKTDVRVTEKDENHFHPNYFPKGMKWQLPDLYRSERGYQTAKSFFEKNDKQIYDATVKGMCTIFEKKSFESFFDKGKKNQNGQS